MTDASESTDGQHRAAKSRSSWLAILDSVGRWTVGLAVIVGGLFCAWKCLSQPPVGQTSVEIVAAPDDPQERVEIPSGSDRLTDMISAEQIKSADHPLDPLMKLADRGLEIIDTKYPDYSAKILTQVRTGDTLHDENVMKLKVRHGREGGEEQIPFSIYTRFLGPKSKAGQEAIWVDGRDDGMILGHGTGFLNVKTVKLDPESRFAMSGNRYPIYEIGFRNLIMKMKEFGKNDRNYGECEVQIDRNVLVDERSCTLVTVTHPIKRDHFEYHIAKIYIDDEFEVITGYEGYLWPETVGGEPVLLEKYFYVDLELNSGLEDVDFDTANAAYDYPRW